MRGVAIILVALLIPALALAQIGFHSAEMTTSWQETNEIWTQEDGNIPPDANVSASKFLGRLRLLDRRGFPSWEFQQLYTHDKFDSVKIDLRVGGYLPTPVKGLILKGTLVEKNSEGTKPNRSFGSYAFYNLDALNIAAGMDYLHKPGSIEKVMSLRAKYKYSIVTPMVGYSTQPDPMDRISLGAVVELPMQFAIGGLYGIWEDESGWAVSFGRYNQRGDYAGLPSMALNYIDVPQTYKWTNFRIMWGDKGGHYVRPTFDDNTFGGIMDVNHTLMLKPLVADNYRNFDSPLLFRRYDEYGTIALRINDIYLANTLRKQDFNLTINPGLSVGVVESIRTVISYGRLHHPVYGWQNDRMSFNVVGFPMGRLLVSATYVTDFDQYEDRVIDMRLRVNFD